jgi:hypothetical protein
MKTGAPQPTDQTTGRGETTPELSAEGTEAEGDASMGTGPGTVYIFNATPNVMNLLLNNSILAVNLAGISVSGTPPYAASPASAPRNPAPGNPGNATFGGQNSLVVNFPAGTAQTYPVAIPPTIQITNDVQLYIFFNEVMLVNPSGTASNPSGTATAIQGRDSTAEEIAAVGIPTPTPEIQA